MIYFHSYKSPGLIIDIVADIRSMNNQAVFAKKTGVIILGGGVVKHHICNANLMVSDATDLSSLGFCQVFLEAVCTVFVS